MEFREISLVALFTKAFFLFGHIQHSDFRYNSSCVLELALSIWISKFLSQPDLWRDSKYCGEFVLSFKDWYEIKSHQRFNPFLSSTVGLLDLSTNLFFGSISHFLCYKMNEPKNMEYLNLGSNVTRWKSPKIWNISILVAISYQGK